MRPRRSMWFYENDAADEMTALANAELTFCNYTPNMGGGGGGGSENRP